MKKLFISLLIVIFLLGCVEPEEMIFENLSNHHYFEEYENPELKSITRLSESDFEKEKEDWEERCEIDIESGQYYKALYENELVRLNVLAEASRMEIICIIELIKTPIEKEETSQLPEIEQEEDASEIDQEEDIIEICEPNWECGDWSECTDETMLRECVDLNECDTNKNKPSEVRNCEIICEEVWLCFDWSECTEGIMERDCIEINDCDTTEFKPETIEEC